MMEGVAPGLFNLLPAVIFLVAVFLAFSTGTSWGTFGIFISIVLPVFLNDPTLLTIGISACLAGAVAGDHCSPISDTIVMASAGSNMNHVDHVSTQLPYVFTMSAVSFVMFVLAGFVQNAFICLPIGVVLPLAVLMVEKDRRSGSRRRGCGRNAAGRGFCRGISNSSRGCLAARSSKGSLVALSASDPATVLVGLVGFRRRFPCACYDDRWCCSRLVERCGSGA